MSGKLIQRLKQHRDMTVAFRQADSYRPNPAPYHAAISAPVQRSEAPPVADEMAEDELQLAPMQGEQAGSIQRSTIQFAAGSAAQPTAAAGVVQRSETPQVQRSDLAQQEDELGAAGAAQLVQRVPVDPASLATSAEMPVMRSVGNAGLSPIKLATGVGDSADSSQRQTTISVAPTSQSTISQSAASAQSASRTAAQREPLSVPTAAVQRSSAIGEVENESVQLKSAETSTPAIQRAATAEPLQRTAQLSASAPSAQSALQAETDDTPVQRAAQTAATAPAVQGQLSPLAAASGATAAVRPTKTSEPVASTSSAAASSNQQTAAAPAGNAITRVWRRVKEAFQPAQRKPVQASAQRIEQVTNAAPGSTAQAGTAASFEGAASPPVQRQAEAFRIAPDVGGVKVTPPSASTPSTSATTVGKVGGLTGATQAIQREVAEPTVQRTSANASDSSVQRQADSVQQYEPVTAALPAPDATSQATGVQRQTDAPAMPTTSSDSTKISRVANVGASPSDAPPAPSTTIARKPVTDSSVQRDAQSATQVQRADSAAESTTKPETQFPARAASGKPSKVQRVALEQPASIQKSSIPAVVAPASSSGAADSVVPSLASEDALPDQAAVQRTALPQASAHSIQREVIPDEDALQLKPSAVARGEASTESVPPTNVAQPSTSDAGAPIQREADSSKQTKQSEAAALAIQRAQASEVQRAQASEVQRAQTPEVQRLQTPEIQREQASDVQRVQSLEVQRTQSPDARRSQNSEIQRTDVNAAQRVQADTAQQTEMDVVQRTISSDVQRAQAVEAQRTQAPHVASEPEQQVVASQSAPMNPPSSDMSQSVQRVDVSPTNSLAALSQVQRQVEQNVQRAAANAEIASDAATQAPQVQRYAAAAVVNQAANPVNVQRVSTQGQLAQPAVNAAASGQPSSSFPSIQTAPSSAASVQRQSTSANSPPVLQAQLAPMAAARNQTRPISKIPVQVARRIAQPASAMRVQQPTAAFQPAVQRAVAGAQPQLNYKPPTYTAAPPVAPSTASNPAVASSATGSSSTVQRAPDSQSVPADTAAIAPPAAALQRQEETPTLDSDWSRLKRISDFHKARKEGAASSSYAAPAAQRKSPVEKPIQRQTEPTASSETADSSQQAAAQSVSGPTAAPTTADKPAPKLDWNAKRALMRKHQSEQDKQRTAGFRPTVSGPKQKPRKAAQRQQVQRDIAPEAPAQDPEQSAAASLESVWPVEQTDSANGAQVARSADSGLPRHETAVDDQVRSILSSVDQTRPAASNTKIELITPRRPRPGSPAQRKVEQRIQRAVEVENEYYDEPAAALDMPSADGAVQRMREVVNGNGASEPSVLQRVSAESDSAPSMVQTDIGELPSDLWTMMGADAPTQDAPSLSSPASPSSNGSGNGLVQRQTAAAAPTADNRNTVGDESGGNSAETGEGESEGDEKKKDEIDVDELAAQVYSQLKRRLAVEWERQNRR